MALLSAIPTNPKAPCGMHKMTYPLSDPEGSRYVLLRCPIIFAFLLVILPFDI